ncbi:hypothetical protein PAEPH01_0929 [Pancytospora epiphaga]|nr:hypothetical protein PAEPH01_0929 [Pancytospora epiphaga]
MEGDNSNTNDNIHYRIKIEQLKKISTKSYVNPRSDGTCGYIALFATLYPFLKDKNHEVSKVFFDSTGYDTIQGLPKPLRYKTISELFTVLKNNMEVHKDLYEYVEYNKVNIVLALRYLAIKRVWNDEKLKKKLMEEKIKSSSELYKFSDSIQPNKVDTFKDLFVPHFLDSEHLGKRAYWMEEFDIDLFSHILNINICAIMISPSSEINNKKYADSAYFVRGVLLITSEDCVYNVNSPMDKNIIANLPVVCLINDCQLCHYLGVIC